MVALEEQPQLGGGAARLRAGGPRSQRRSNRMWATAQGGVGEGGHPLFLWWLPRVAMTTAGGGYDGCLVEGGRSRGEGGISTRFKSGRIIL